MKNALRNSLMAAGMGLMLLEMANAADSKPRLAVCVYNYARVPSSTLKKAEQIAQKIFEQAGVETTWEEIALVKEGKLDGPVECTSTMPRVEVNLVNNANFGLRTTVLGIAPGSINETDRHAVYVFDQVATRIIDSESVADKATILGHAMAHEIGHILAQIENHSRFGLMRAKWRDGDFQDMVRGCLTFDSDQAARIRNELTRRTGELAMTDLADSSH